MSNKTLKNAFDAIRLDYLAECADLITSRAVALRMALVDHNIDAADAIFESIRAIAKSYAATRKEIETIEQASDDDREAA